MASFLSPGQSKCLAFDRRCLADLGLSLPRVTRKYWFGAMRLASFRSCSVYFIHVLAARFGFGYVYEELEGIGFCWRGGRWVLR